METEVLTLSGRNEHFFFGVNVGCTESQSGYVMTSEIQFRVEVIWNHCHTQQCTHSFLVCERHELCVNVAVCVCRISSLLTLVASDAQW